MAVVFNTEAYPITASGKYIVGEFLNMDETWSFRYMHGQPELWLYNVITRPSSGSNWVKQLFSMILI